MRKERRVKVMKIGMEKEQLEDLLMVCGKDKNKDGD